MTTTANAREAVKAEAERRYPKRAFVQESYTQAAFIAGASWAWRLRGEADAEAVVAEFLSDEGPFDYAHSAWVQGGADALAAVGALDEERTDPEQFCNRCFAGVESNEHHEKCVVTGHAEDGESA